jgi:hypothetical protein
MTKPNNTLLKKQVTFNVHTDTQQAVSVFINCFVFLQKIWHYFFLNFLILCNKKEEYKLC